MAGNMVGYFGKWEKCERNPRFWTNDQGHSGKAENLTAIFILLRRLHSSLSEIVEEEGEEEEEEEKEVGGISSSERMNGVLTPALMCSSFATRCRGSLRLRLALLIFSKTLTLYHFFVF